MSEQQLLDAVVDLAHARHWLVSHQRTSRRGDGTWRTTIQGARGLPDLVLVRREHSAQNPGGNTYMIRTGGHVQGWNMPRILFVELKSDTGKVSPEQQAWLDALSPYSCVWRPSMWHSGEIERALR